MSCTSRERHESGQTMSFFLTTVLRLKSSAISGNYWSKHHCITQKNLRTVSHFSQSFNAGGHLLRGPLRNHWKDGGFTRKCFRTCWYTLHIGNIERWKMCKWWLFYFLCKHLQENKCEVQVEVKRKKIERKNNNFTDGFTCNIFCFFRIEWKMMKGTYENTQEKKHIYIYTIANGLLETTKHCKGWPHISELDSKVWHFRKPCWCTRKNSPMSVRLNVWISLKMWYPLKKKMVLGIPHFQTHPYIIYNHIYIL